MQFGPSLGEACVTFVLTNIDDFFVLVTFYAEAIIASSSLSPVTITIGQFAGFTVIMIISMIGYAVALAVPPEPIGFLGLLPVMLGLWNLCDLLIPKPEGVEDDEEAEQREATRSRFASATTWMAIAKVGLVTVMNGGDDVGTYIPLFSQLSGSEIAVYAVTYYVLLGVWCLAAYLIIRQKHVLRVARKYTEYIIPFLYMGLGVYIIAKSDCYPWTIQQINNSTAPDPGTGIMAGVTTCVLLASIGIMAWMKWRKRERGSSSGNNTGVVDTDANHVIDGRVGYNGASQQGIELDDQTRD